MAEGERGLVPRPNKYDRATEGPSRTDVPPTLGNREIIRTKTFVTKAANFILQRARDALGARGEFRVALSGGQFRGQLRSKNGFTATDVHVPVDFCGASRFFSNRREQRSEVNRERVFRRSCPSRRAHRPECETGEVDYRTEIVIQLF
jgi:hypothetical protein